MTRDGSPGFARQRHKRGRGRGDGDPTRVTHIARPRIITIRRTKRLCQTTLRLRMLTIRLVHISHAAGDIDPVSAAAYFPRHGSARDGVARFLLLSHIS